MTGLDFLVLFDQVEDPLIFKAGKKDLNIFLVLQKVGPRRESLGNLNE